MSDDPQKTVANFKLRVRESHSKLVSDILKLTALLGVMMIPLLLIALGQLYFCKIDNSKTPWMECFSSIRQWDKTYKDLKK